MLREATETVVFEIFPGPLAELKADIMAAAKRGVRVAGLVLSPEDVIEGVKCVVSPQGKAIEEAFPGQQVTLVVDAAQFLVALVDRGGQVQHGMWTANSYLAFLFGNGIVSDVVLHGVTTSTRSAAARTGICSGTFRPATTPSWTRRLRLRRPVANAKLVSGPAIARLQPWRHCSFVPSG